MTMTTTTTTLTVDVVTRKERLYILHIHAAVEGQLFVMVQLPSRCLNPHRRATTMDAGKIVTIRQGRRTQVISTPRSQLPSWVLQLE